MTNKQTISTARNHDCVPSLERSTLPALGADPLVVSPVGGDQRDGEQSEAFDRHGSPRDRLPPIVRSKVEAPPLRASTLTRHRLLDGIAVLGDRRLALVIAEAGFGKTTLLSDFSRRFPGRCIWYRLDETDGDWITLVNYILASIREAVPEFGGATARLLEPITGSSPPKDVVLASLMAELNLLRDQPTVLVLDDFQTVDDCSDARDLVKRLVRDGPPTFRLIVSSRRRPGLPLGKWFAGDGVAELSTDDLRFSKGEISRLFAEAYGQPLDADVLDELDLRTQGWAVSLQLFHSLVQGRSDAQVRTVIWSLSGATSPIYEFLAEELLEQLAPDLQDFAQRTAILDHILPDYAFATMPVDGAATKQSVTRLIDRAERAGLISGTSQAGGARQFHPLLREFLLRRLRERHDAADIAEMHARVAKAAESVDLIAACQHYIEAGLPGKGMECLAESVLLTMGSGRWGAASQLVERLTEVPADPAVTAIRARRLQDQGDLEAAHLLLADLAVSALSPPLRAVVRHTRLSLGWRRGDSDSVFATLREIRSDDETPALLRDIAQVFIDTSSMSHTRAPLPVVSNRLRAMAARQRASGHDYYAAVSLHNAAVTSQNAGAFVDAERLGLEALDAYDRLAFPATEKYSIHTLLATAAFELGRVDTALEHVRLATSSEHAEGDVFGELAYVLAAIGDKARALEYLQRAELLERTGRLDMEGRNQAVRTRALLAVSRDPRLSLQMLDVLPSVTPLDFGYNILAKVLQTVALLLLGDEGQASDISESAMVEGMAQGNGRAVARVGITASLARGRPTDILAAISIAAKSGNLALLEVADAIGAYLYAITPVPDEISESIERWPHRWRPVLRQQLEVGNTPTAHIAADLLDRYGDATDVGRLRAFSKTYRRGRKDALGRSLARRLSPRLHLNDLGRGSVHIGTRTTPVNQIRRKPAALLMYLVTRPNFTATREQVLEDLWPDGDPDSGANSLNQSLHFLRRELDPWYEVDVSHDYVVFESELLWLDNDLTDVASTSFLREARRIDVAAVPAEEVVSLIQRYTGQFCPEFEYDEWAITWRARVHAAYLDLAHQGIRTLAFRSDLASALAIANSALTIDPTASDIERKLIWLYAKSGSDSAANAQFEHMASAMRADGLIPPSLGEVIRSPRLM